LKTVNLDSNYTYEVGILDNLAWTDLLQQFDDATIYQTWAYGAVRWRENNLSHLVLKREGEVVGIAQLCIKKIPFAGFGIAYIPWGPLWQKKGETDNLENLKYVIKALTKEYVTGRRLLLRVEPNNIDDGHGEMRFIFENCGFRLSKARQPYRTLMVDLAPSLQELRKGLNQKWRNQLNRSEKNALTVIEGSGDDLYQKFMNLQKEMRERKNFLPGVDCEEFREIQKNLLDAHKMNIIVCEYEGVPVTVTIGTAVGNTGIYLLGATGNKGLNLKGAYLSQWLMIQWLKDRGCRWYDLGGINPENNPGVFHFKAGLSGKDTYHIGQFEICNNLISRFLVFWGNQMKIVIDKIRSSWMIFRANIVKL